MASHSVSKDNYGTMSRWLNFHVKTLQTDFIIHVCPTDHKQLQVEVRLHVFIDLLYFGPFDLDLKFLFKVTGAYYESGIYQFCIFKSLYCFAMFSLMVASLLLKFSNMFNVVTFHVQYLVFSI